MRKFTPKELILGGVGAVVLGFLYYVGGVLAGVFIDWMASPTLSLGSVVFSIITACGVVAIAYGVRELRSDRKRSPSGSQSEDGTPSKGLPEFLFREGNVDVSHKNGKTSHLLRVNSRSRSYAMVYDRTHHSIPLGGLKASVRVTPRTLYRFALGVWTSINPLTFENRLGILEVNMDAFRMSYTEYKIPPDGVGFQIIHDLRGNDFPIPKPRVGVTYILELAVNWDAGAITGRVYDEGHNPLGDEMRIVRTVPRATMGDVWVGVAVWTDEVACPLSSYEIENFEVN